MTVAKLFRRGVEDELPTVPTTLTAKHGDFRNDVKRILNVTTSQVSIQRLLFLHDGGITRLGPRNP